MISKKEFLNTDDQEKYRLGLIYAKKNSTNFFKLLYYTLSVIVAYNILSHLPYFPSYFGGNGEISIMYKDGYPNYFFHEKPEYFNVFYLGILAFHMSDLIWLLWIYELQTDFLMMLVHHFCTISLITFSYLSNNSNIGCIIIFLHDFGDIFVYIARILLYTNAPEFTKVGSGILLLLVWIYTRIYIFFGVIRDCHAGLYDNINWVTQILIGFLCFLYVLHCYWVFLIFKKICAALFVKKYEDTFKVKKIR